MYISEKFKTELKYSCDVLVCGGGIAGIAAAISAARSGKSVILTERQFMLGGLATAGLVTIYLPLCDGMGNQVSFGLAEELLKLSIMHWHNNKRGYSNWIENTDIKNNEKTPRYEVDFNPQLFAISAEQLLLKENVKILYGTTAVAASVENDKIKAVIFENKSGRFGIAAKTFIDATGDADLGKFSDTPTETFKQGNVLAAWYYSNENDGYGLKTLGCADVPDSEKTEDNTVDLLSTKRYTGLDGEEISNFMISSHSSTMNDFLKQKESKPNFQPTTIATIPQLRMTRRVSGEYTLDDKEMYKHFEDSVGLVSDWRKRGPVYEVPFRTLYSSNTKNLLFAGRITSVTDSMWDIMRVIPCCAVTGEAAGIAASMCDDMTKLDVSKLQTELRHRGVKVHYNGNFVCKDKI